MDISSGEQRGGVHRNPTHRDGEEVVQSSRQLERVSLKNLLGDHIQQLLHLGRLVVLYR